MPIYAFLSNISVSDVKSEVVKLHKRGIMSYSAFTKSLIEN